MFRATFSGLTPGSRLDEYELDSKVSWLLRGDWSLILCVCREEGGPLVTGEPNVFSLNSTGGFS